MILTSVQIEERRRRSRLAVAAYAYEIMNRPIMSDSEFDLECHKINLSISTGDPEWDKWWSYNFEPHTGMWIYKHPDKEKLKEIAEGLLSYG